MVIERPRPPRTPRTQQTPLAPQAPRRTRTAALARLAVMGSEASGTLAAPACHFRSCLAIHHFLLFFLFLFVRFRHWSSRPSVSNNPSCITQLPKSSGRASLPSGASFSLTIRMISRFWAVRNAYLDITGDRCTRAQLPVDSQIGRDGKPREMQGTGEATMGHGVRDYVGCNSTI